MTERPYGEGDHDRGDSVLEIAPEVGELVRARGQQWVVNRRSTSTQPRDELAAELPGVPLWVDS